MLSIHNPGADDIGIISFYLEFAMRGEFSKVKHEKDCQLT
jgi:hypothetical protein